MYVAQTWAARTLRGVSSLSAHDEKGLKGVQRDLPLPFIHLTASSRQ